MKRFALTLVVLTLLGGRQAKSATFDYDTVIDYYFADTVEVHDGAASTTVDIVSGATLVYGAEVYQTSTMNVRGGIIYNNLIADDLSTANIYGGWFDMNVRGKDFSTINLFGGHVEDTLEASDSATMNVFGGEFYGIRAGGNSDFTVVGSGFNFPYGAITENSGRLTGTLANGDPIDAAFDIYGNASIVLAAAEPSSVALLATAAFGLVGCAWRRRRVA